MKYDERAVPKGAMSRSSKLDWVRWPRPSYIRYNTHTDRICFAAQVETQLKTKTKEKRPSIADETIPNEQCQPTSNPVRESPSDYAFPNGGATIDVMGVTAPPLTYFDDITIASASSAGQGMMPDALPETAPDLNLNLNLNQTSLFDDGMTWEMVGLGLEEPLPTQEAIDELLAVFQSITLITS